MADNELGPINMAWIYPIMGYGTFDAAATEKAKVNMKKFLDGLNQLLATQTYLVTEAVSLADIVMVCHMTHLVKMVLDAEFLAPYKNVVRWFTTCVNQPHFKAVLGEPEFAKKALVFGDKLPEAKPQPKAAASPKKDAKPAKQAKPEIEDLEAIAAAEQEKPKEKNPLDLLPKSTFVLDEWKRMYSNNETRPTAIDWFWKNYDPTGYSIWKCDYKYNSELTQIFMSSNLVGGFYQRLDRARKYAFGSMLILGEDKNNVITGHFVFRGHGIPFEVSDAADYDSYTFTRINDKDQKAREDFNAVIAWDDKIYGKPCADGKVFK